VKRISKFLSEVCSVRIWFREKLFFVRQAGKPLKGVESFQLQGAAIGGWSRFATFVIFSVIVMPLALLFLLSSLPVTAFLRYFFCPVFLTVHPNLPLSNVNRRL